MAEVSPEKCCVTVWLAVVSEHRKVAALPTKVGTLDDLTEAPPLDVPKRPFFVCILCRFVKC